MAGKSLDNMDEINLKWEGPKKLYDPEDDYSLATDRYFNLKAGVYLWGFKFKENYIINYVGQSKYLMTRFQEHINNTLNGNYQILNSANLKNEGKVNLVYSCDNEFWKIEYLRKYKELSIEAYNNILASEIFISTIDEKDIPKLRLIESALINELLKNEETKKYITSPRLSALPKDGEGIRIISNFDNSIPLGFIKKDIIEYTTSITTFMN